MLQIEELTERDFRLPALLQLWEASVRASHYFLQEPDIVMLRPVVRQALLEVPQLAIIWKDDVLAGFVGADGDKVEMLFLMPVQRSIGLGRVLLQYALEQWHCNKVDVNEQNEAAVGFYRHMGFHVIGRSPLDEQGKPFPILHLTCTSPSGCTKN